MVILVGLFGFVSIYLILRLVEMKKQIVNITEQLEDLSCGRTEKQINLALIDEDLNQLVIKINENMESQRQLLIDRNKHERQFKDSIANISHDLRTPLTAIIGYLQMLQKTELSENQAEKTAIIMKKALAMQGLVEVFFELSVIESDTSQPHYEKVNLSNLLMDAVIDNAPGFETRNIEPKITIPQKSVLVMGDELYLKRIVQNLISNALRYGEKVIEIELLAYELEVVIKVSNDTDVVVVNQEQLFERFYTGDHSRSGGSTGLGLYIVKLLTEKQNGSVKVELLKQHLSINIHLRI